VQKQRQRRESRQHRPGERDQQKSVARLQFAPELARGDGQQDAGAGSDQDCNVVIPQRLVAAEEGERQRHQHRRRKQQHDVAEHIQDGEEQAGERVHGRCPKAARIMRRGRTQTGAARHRSCRRAA
jgi:hypothetical protein